jgi:hypothetical protein
MGTVRVGLDIGGWTGTLAGAQREHGDHDAGCGRAIQLVHGVSGHRLAVPWPHRGASCRPTTPLKSATATSLVAHRAAVQPDAAACDDRDGGIIASPVIDFVATSRPTQHVGSTRHRLAPSWSWRSALRLRLRCRFRPRPLPNDNDNTAFYTSWSGWCADARAVMLIEAYLQKSRGRCWRPDYGRRSSRSVESERVGEHTAADPC